MNTVFCRAAQEFAIQRHGFAYYENHLAKVAQIGVAFWQPPLSEKYTKEQMYAICLLHDTIEDTGTTKEELQKKFGFIVADAVWRLSDEEGANRKERKLKTYPKIRHRPISVYGKLCDRLQNIQRRGKVSMYRKEHSEFKAALYIEGEFEDLWNEIEKYLEAV